MSCVVRDCCPARRLWTILAAIVRSSIGRKSGNAARRCRPVRNSRARLGNGGVLVHIWVRSICAGIAALAIGVALESVGRHVVGAASAGLRAESALFSVFETIRPKSLDHRASLVRVASLETGFFFQAFSRGVGAIGVNEPPRFFRRAFSLRPKPRFIRRALCGR